jgi:arylsulfatase A-like enzyme
MIRNGGITRREMLRLTAGAAALAALGRHSLARAETFSAPAVSTRTRRPNIIMLVGDDHRHDAINALGDSVVQTPFLNRLAAGGTAFTQAHDMGGNFSAVCVPTRGCLMTGCNVYRALADQSGGVIAPERVTLGEHLRGAGYQTYCVGKWHNDLASLNRSFAGGEAIFRRGLNTDQYEMRVHHYDPTGVYGNNTVYHAKKFSTDFLADTAVDFLHRRRGDDEPFFLYTAFTAPHDPRTPPKAFADLYRADQIPLPPNFAAQHPFDNGELAVRDEGTAPMPRTPMRTRQEIAAYYGMISNLDAGVGRILAALEASGQAENTIVVYTADHGLALGQHGLMGKQNLYDHSVRVPLILHGPGIPAGRRSDALLYAWDLFPTLCDLAGIAAPGDLDARSLGPVLRGERSAHREYIQALYRDYQRMVKNDRWKLIEYAVGDQRHTQLFDVKHDPWEQHNLASAPEAAAELSNLRTRLQEWQLAVGDATPPGRFSGPAIVAA